MTTITSPCCWGNHFLYLSNPPSGNLLPIIPWSEYYLAGEDEAQEYCDGELAVAEEDDVEEVRVGGVLQEKPGT